MLPILPKENLSSWDLKMNIEQAIKAFEFRISGGSDYCWKCFGDNARYMDFQDIEGQPCGSIIYDRLNQTVYEISAEVPGRDITVRWLNPDFKQAYHTECHSRGSDPSEAWDGVNWTNVETEELILEYVNSIVNGEYDNLPPESTSKVGPDGRVSVPIDIPDDELFLLMQKAHEADMTLNKFVEQILQASIDEENKKKTMDMPGTIGGAKVVFKDDESKTQNYIVDLDVRYTFEVETTGYGEAVEKAKKFRETMPTGWGKEENVSWIDTEVVKESVERLDTSF